jgi:hypothetical protein
MTIANLGELRGAIEDNLARGDLQSLFPVYVKIFESKFNTSVRIAEMEVATTLDVTNGVATLPSGFLELRNVQGQDEQSDLLSLWYELGFHLGVTGYG